MSLEGFSPYAPSIPFIYYSQEEKTRRGLIDHQLFQTCTKAT